MFFQIRSYAIKEGGCISPQSCGERIWMNPMDEMNKVKDNHLNEVSGGKDWLPEFSNEWYRDAGVEVVGSGWISNEGYRFNGEDISDYDASVLVRYYMHNVTIAPSLEEAKAWYKVVYPNG